MKRVSLYTIYAILIVLGTIAYLFFKGPLSVIMLGITVFLLYALSLFLLDARRITDPPLSLRAFIRHRRVALAMFFFSLAVLAILILQSHQ